MVWDSGGALCDSSSKKTWLPSETGCSPLLAHLGHCRDQSSSWSNSHFHTFIWWVMKGHTCTWKICLRKAEQNLFFSHHVWVNNSFIPSKQSLRHSYLRSTVLRFCKYVIIHNIHALGWLWMECHSKSDCTEFPSVILLYLMSPSNISFELNFHWQS
jgi:hypothetical protein